MEMTLPALSGEEAQKFMVWLTMIKGFLPKSMTIAEAQNIFMRKRDDEKKESKAN